MSAVEESALSIDGAEYRVWTAGAGPTLGVLAGFGGLLQWTPFLARLAETRRVVVPALPGFPGGGGRAHVGLDSQLDWLLRVRDLLEGCGLVGRDLAGVSLGAALAADVAAVWPGTARRLALVSPLGLCDGDSPIADPWAVRPNGQPALLCADPAALEAHREMPDGADDLEWEVSQIRANEAAARLLWPNGDTGLGARIGRIACDTLLVWGAEDRVVPASHRPLYRNGPAGAVREATIAGAGHQADFDRPEETAGAIDDFLGRGE